MSKIISTKLFSFDSPGLEVSQIRTSVLVGKKLRERHDVMMKYEKYEKDLHKFDYEKKWDYISFTVGQWRDHCLMAQDILSIIQNNVKYYEQILDNNKNHSWEAYKWIKNTSNSWSFPTRKIPLLSSPYSWWWKWLASRRNWNILQKYKFLDAKSIPITCLLYTSDAADE